jgi:peptide/nickel transport system ATP-binding protein
VLYQGRVVEQGRPDTLFQAAAHPYTRALMAAVPRAMPGARRGPRAALLPALAPPPAGALTGCAFAHRCAWRQAACLQSAPDLRKLSRHHAAACHHAERVLAAESGP